MFIEDHSHPNLCLVAHVDTREGDMAELFPSPLWPTGTQSLIFELDVLGTPFMTSLLVHSKASKLSRSKYQIYPTE